MPLCLLETMDWIKSTESVRPFPICLGPVMGAYVRSNPVTDNTTDGARYRNSPRLMRDNSRLAVTQGQARRVEYTYARAITPCHHRPHKTPVCETVQVEHLYVPNAQVLLSPPPTLILVKSENHPSTNSGRHL